MRCDQCGLQVDEDQAEDWPRLWIMGDKQEIRLNHKVNDFCSPLCAAAFAKRIAENEIKNRS